MLSAIDYAAHRMIAHRYNIDRLDDLIPTGGQGPTTNGKYNRPTTSKVLALQKKKPRLISEFEQAKQDL
jgi:hypothetical protein